MEPKKKRRPAGEIGGVIRGPDGGTTDKPQDQPTIRAVEATDADDVVEEARNSLKFYFVELYFENWLATPEGQAALRAACERTKLIRRMEKLTKQLLPDPDKV